MNKVTSNLCHLLFALAFIFAASSFATPAKAADIDKIVSEIKTWYQDPVILITLQARNAQNGKITQADIDALDKQWVEERKSDDQPLIGPALSNPLSSFVIKKQAESRGRYVEIIVMDDKGLNAGQSDITSDYWQGDEAKFQETYLKGPDGMNLGDPETHDDGSTTQQINLAIPDPDTGKAIGAITVEVDLGRY